MMAFVSNQTVPVCIDSISQTLTITVGGGTNSCFANINKNNMGGCAWQFTAVNMPASMPGVNYAWNFGDGTSGTGNPVSHTYANQGTYTVTLVISTSMCNYTTTTFVNCGGNTTSTLNCNWLFANFSYYHTGSLSLQFTNTSTNPMVGNIIRKPTWYFGDGTSSLLPNPSKTYTVAGTYNVKLVNQWVDSATSNVLCTDSITQSVNVNSITNTTPNIIAGTIYWDSMNNATTVPVQLALKVWLIVHDSANNTLTAVDSISGTGGYFNTSYAFYNKPAGKYRVKAAVQNGTPGFWGLIPTYHDSTLYWNSAKVINHNAGISNGHNIKMRKGIITAGPGFIGGNISLGAGKGTGSGVPDLLVVARNISNDVVTFTYTDANGDYQFINLQVGTYNIYPEEINRTTIPSSTLVVSNSQPNVTGIDFERTSTAIKPKSLGISSLPDANLFSISPNPSNGHVQINWTKSNGSATVHVADMTGRKVLTSENPMTQSVQLDLTNLSSGLYFIHVMTDTAQQTEKMIIQK